MFEITSDTKNVTVKVPFLFCGYATNAFAAAGTKVRHSLSEHLELRCEIVIRIRRHAVTESWAGRGQTSTQFTRSRQAMAGDVRLYTAIYNAHYKPESIFISEHKIME